MGTGSLGIYFFFYMKLAPRNCICISLDSFCVILKCVELKPFVTQKSGGGGNTFSQHCMSALSTRSESTGMPPKVCRGVLQLK